MDAAGTQQDEKAYGRELDDDEEEDEDEEEEEEEDGENPSDDENANQWDSGNEDGDWMPSALLKDAAYEPDGPIGRLLRAVNESDYPPVRADWAKYILELAVGTNAVIGAPPKPLITATATGGPSARTRQINQIDMASGTVVRQWESIAAAARNMTLTLAEINGALVGKTDSAGGFKWEYVLAAATAAGGAGGEEDEGDEEEVSEKILFY